MVGTQLHSGVDAGDIGNAFHLDESSFVDHGDQDAVDNKASSLVDLNGGLADFNADLFDGLNSLGGGVHACNDLDELHTVSGVEEVHTNQGTGQALADLSDGQRRGVGSKDALRLADLVQLAKGGLLDLHILKSSLNDQVAVSAQIFFQASGDGSHTAVNFSLIQLALGNQLCIASCDLILAFIGPFLLDITQGNSEALSLCKCLSNTLAHSASANNANFHSCASC